jgi:hypothetical protein
VVAEQWCNDVDHLVITAINTLPHRRQWAHQSRGSPKPLPTLSCTPTAGCVPTATSLTMTDLNAELEHRHSGEDGHTTIESQRERRHNLKDHYGTPNAAPVGHVAHPPSSPGTKAGCAMLAPHLRMVVWPRKFWPHLLEKYDGTINPTEFLPIYTTSIQTAGGNDRGHQGQLFSCGFDRHSLVVAHEPTLRVFILLGRVVPIDHNQL